MPYKTPKHVQEKKDAKKHHILDAALKLFAVKGFENTSIQDICKAAEVSVGSMYFYFPSKEDIYEEVYSRINNESLQQLERAIDGVSSLKEIIQRIIETFVLSSVPNRAEAQFFVTNRTFKPSGPFHHNIAKYWIGCYTGWDSHPLLVMARQYFQYVSYS